MLDSLTNWNPFERLWERDSDRVVRPDITYLTQDIRRVPVVGVVLIHPQEEYGRRDRHVEAHAAIQRLLDTREVAAVPIDTRLDENLTGLRTPAEVDSLIARMDMVVTTRLHGTVLALKNAVPALVVDPIEGGAKITRQVRAVGWPVLHNVESLDHEALLRDFAFCLTDAARVQARKCRDRAIRALEEVHRAFVGSISC
jgi:polysaccharide pyruvyl transferase WcaK-like protein